MPKDNIKAAKIVAKANLPSKFGDFMIYVFSTRDGKEHTAIVKGDVLNQTDVPLRIHSECLTGDVFGSLRCDCGEQLEKSLKFISKQERGVVLYLRQEGRGIGLNNKIRAYELQDKGLDTYEANTALGFQPDERSYDVSVEMIYALKIKSVILLTNNPDKVNALKDSGLRVERLPHIVEYNSFNRFYIETKKEKFGHLFDEKVELRPFFYRFWERFVK